MFTRLFHLFNMPAYSFVPDNDGTSHALESQPSSIRLSPPNPRSMEKSLNLIDHPKSPTKNGIMKEDRHYIIKIGKNSGVSNPDAQSQAVRPVFASKVKYDLWRRSPMLFELSKSVNVIWERGDERWVARRVNNEVEIFAHDERMGTEEYEGLKKALERGGLTVRDYVSQADKSRYPKVSYKTVQGEEEGKVTLMKRIQEKMEGYVKAVEEQHETSIEYGFIADVPGKTKALAVARVDAEQLLLFEEGETTTLPARNAFGLAEGAEANWVIIGTIRDGEPKFTVDEDTVKSYFDGIGKTGPISWIDYAKDKEIAEREGRKAEKKAAKKQRRKMAESVTSGDTPTELSFDAKIEDDEEIVKARQRAKANEKRKRQKQEKKDRKEVVDNLFTIKTKPIDSATSSPAKSKSKGKHNTNLRHIQAFGRQDIYQDENGNTLRRPSSPEGEENSTNLDGFQDGTQIKQGKHSFSVNLPNMQSKQPYVTTDEVSGKDVKIFQVNSIEEFREVQRQCFERGDQVSVAVPEGVKEGDALEIDEKSRGFKYVGKGL